MAQRQPLVKGGQLYLPTTSCQTSYMTHTVPFVHPKSYILAAASPTTGQSDPTQDGGFLSDFFAFNAILKDVGSGQTWLTVADVDKIISEHGELFHGNPYREPRVVLSRELLDTSKLTPPTRVKPGDLIGKFKQRAASLSKRAAMEHVPLVLLLFCHGRGAPTYEFYLDGQSVAGLRPLDLKGVLEPSAQVVLVTTASHSGGWMIDTDLNRSIATATGHESESMAWPDLYPFGFPGSIFASSLTDTLTSTTSPLLEHYGATSQTASEEKPLQPETPTHGQRLTYNALCMAVVESCVRLTRLSDQHELSFGCVDGCRDDSWPNNPGVSIHDYQKIWNGLPVRPYTGAPPALDQDSRNSRIRDGLGMGIAQTGGVQEVKATLTKHIKCKNVQALAWTFSMCTCPGDWTRGTSIAYYGMLRSCGDGKRPNTISSCGRDEYDFDWTDDIDAYASIIYRFEWAALTDFIVQKFRLLMPYNQECLFWRRDEWESQNWQLRRSPAYQEVHTKLREGGFCAPPSMAQGPDFTRPVSYLTSAIMLSDAREPSRSEMVGAILSFIQRVELFEHARMMPSVVRDPTVRLPAQSWLSTLDGGYSLGSRQLEASCEVVDP